MKLSVKRESADDPNYVDSEMLLKPYITEHQDITHLASKQELREAIDNITVLNEGVFDLNAPVSIASTNAVEDFLDRQGLLYFDIVNQRLRICTASGWKTVKL